MRASAKPLPIEGSAREFPLDQDMRRAEGALQHRFALLDQMG
jgi:hypothetical protein